MSNRSILCAFVMLAIALLPAANAAGDFIFPDETRFPRHEIERGAAGKPALDENRLQDGDRVLK